MKDHMAFDELKHFRRQGDCPTCGRLMGVQCTRCGTHVLPDEDYCVHCGWDKLSGMAVETGIASQWSEEEFAVLKSTAEDQQEKLQEE
jgi:hypothetical protein